MITIPGNVDSVRRHYNEVLDVFENIWKTGRRDIMLNLLGSKKSEKDKFIFDRLYQIKDKYGDDVIRFWKSSLLTMFLKKGLFLLILFCVI